MPSTFSNYLNPAMNAWRITEAPPPSAAMPPVEPQDVDAILKERGSRYGPFMGHAQVSCDLKKAVRLHLAARNKQLSDSQQEALDMIFHKIGRIVNGDPNYADSWVDIAGYAKLVADELEGVSR